MKKILQILLILLLGIPFSAKAGTSEGFPKSFSEKQSPDHGSITASISQNAVTDSDRISNYESSGLISETSSASQKTESAAIWPFKPKYNQNRIQRKNTPAKKNRRNKTLLRKWGLGALEMEVCNG